MSHPYDPRALSAIVDLIYESMLEPDVWPRILEDLCGLLGGSSATIMARAPINRDGFWVPYRIDPASIEPYERYYQRISPWRMALPDCPPGRMAVLRGEDLVDDADFLASECYNDYLAPLNLRWTRAVHLRPDAPRAPAYTLGVFRGPGEAPFSEGFEDALGEVGRHLLRVERLSSALAFWHGGQPIDASVAAFALTARGRLVECNPAAEAMLDRGVALNGSRVLAFTSQRVALWIHGLFNSARGPAAGEARAWRLANEPLMPDERYDFELVPLRTACAAPALRLVRWMLLVRRARGAHGADAAQDVLVERFRWTPSEADAVRRLAAGQRLPEIAAARRSSVETVRSHLKSAKRKAGVNRQTDLVRIVLEAVREAGSGED